MNLWLLRPADRDNPMDDPWDPWFNKAFGFVVRAETEEDARRFADCDAGEENRGTFLGKKITETNAPWLDPKYSTCERLLDDGEAGIIIKDFSSA